MIVMEAFGRALALEPFLATVVLGGGFLRHGGNAEQSRRSDSQDRRWQPDPCLCPYRAAFALQPCRHFHHGGRATAPAGARRREGGRAAWRHRRQADRHRADRRRAARSRWDRRLYRRRQGTPACRGAATRPRMACAPRKSLSPVSGSGRRRCSASRARHCRLSNASSTRRSRHSAPRRSARWR